MHFPLYKQQTATEKMEINKRKNLYLDVMWCAGAQRSQQKQTTTANKSVSSSVFYIWTSSGFFFCSAERQSFYG